jgi:hypothetical protein
MALTTKEEIKRFHYEEILLILFICSSDLSYYDDSDLIDFAELIEGRADILFEPSYLQKYSDYFEINSDTLEDFSELRGLIMNLYGSQWHTRISENNSDWVEIKILARTILNKLKITYIEPKKYIDDYLEI